MNKIFHWIVVVCLLPIMIFSQNEPGKKCLIIAIGDYKYLKPISSQNDIPLIRSALEGQGFKDFRIIQDKEATRTNIIKEFARLEKDTKPGEIVVIHFSAHGQGVPDDNNDEADGIDESICCYGAKEYIDDEYKGEEHLRDDLIGEWINKIRLKAGSKGQVLVLLDACYSGSGTRGEDVKTRGVKNLLLKKGEKSSRTINEDPALQVVDPKKGNVLLARLTVFSGSRADEANYEYQGQGSLSYSFNKALTTIRDRNFSYRSLFAEINMIMSTIARLQNPVAEGEGIDDLVFGDGPLLSPKYFSAIEFDQKKLQIKISGGRITGIYPSTKIGFYKAGTTDPTKTKPLFNGTVVSSNSLFSIASVEQIPEDFTIQSVWCYILQTSVSLDTIKIVISGEVLTKLPNNFIEDITKFRLTKIVDNRFQGDLIIENSDENGMFKISASKTGVSILDSTADVVKMKNVIKNFTKARLFESMNIFNEDIALKIELVPVKFDKQARKVTDTLKIADFYKNGVFTVTENDHFMIRVINGGNEKAFFNIIDIEENANLMLLIPYLKKNESPANYFIEPGTEFIIPNFLYKFRNRTTKSYTSETIKLIATTEPLDLRYAFMRDAGLDPGSDQSGHSFLKEIIMMDDSLMNRGEITSPSDEMVSTSTITIRKKKTQP